MELIDPKREHILMDNTININFKVTPSQKETIDSRANENGFSDTASYLKVVALKMDRFILTDAGSATEEKSIELSFTVTPEQKTRIEENMKVSDCQDMSRYLEYVGMYGAISAVVEVRSSGNLEAMLARIAKAKGK
ncbi:hypothetical protein N9A28_01560 [Sulfurimonas sp.]|nr:hypothetical protein [Sulfurimonas sp.]